MSYDGAVIIDGKLYLSPARFAQMRADVVDAESRGEGPDGAAYFALARAVGITAARKRLKERPYAPLEVVVEHAPQRLFQACGGKHPDIGHDKAPPPA